MALKPVFSILACIVMVMATTGCVGSDDTEYRSTYNPAPLPTLARDDTSARPAATASSVAASVKETFTVSDVTEELDTSNPYISTYTISGKITNNGKTAKRLISVKAEFYDADDIKLGFSSGYVDELRPGETGRFEITCFDKKVIDDLARFTLTTSSI